MKQIKKPVEFLLQNGLIFEINRKVLHPLGLALFVDISDDGKIVISHILDCRKDPEGILFSPDSWESGKQKFDEYMEAHGKKSLETRLDKIGFIEQEEK